ncbi:hypothetical protein OAJ27_01080 [bacterium]|nr:hypothetical protein [bacterium]
MRTLLIIFLFSITFTLSSIFAVLQFNSSTNQVNPNKMELAFDSFGNTDTDVFKSGESEGETSTNVLIFPSPCPDFICHAGIRVKNGLIRNVKLQIFDMTGSMITEKEVTLSSGYNKISLRELIDYQPSTGVYRLLLYKEDATLISKTKFGVITKGGEQ